MSTNLECMFFEYKPDNWYYALESDFGDKNAWDWREDASAYGPFKNFEEADQHLRDHHANPGGYNVHEYGSMKQSDVIDSLVNQAPQNMKSFTNFSFRGRW